LVCRYLSAVAAIVACLAPHRPACSAPAEGKFGGALMTTEGCAEAAANALYASIPLTVECWAKLDGKAGYNILVANETKGSATHWELFTTPKDGFFHAYLPGRKPDHCHTTTDIVDGKWHCLAMTAEPDRVRLFVDGVEKGSTAAASPTDPGKRAPLAFGALVERGLSCVGRIDEVRLSKGVRAIDRVPTAEFTADDRTLGLWHFDELKDGKYADASTAHNEATLKRDTTRVFVGQQAIPGGMPTEYQPLPPPEDTAPLRAALADAVRQLGLGTVDPAVIRDEVLRDWSYQLKWYGKHEYAESRPDGSDKQAVAAQTFDKHALIWDTDGGPLGTVLRRTHALAERLQGLHPELVLAPWLEDLTKLDGADQTDQTRSSAGRYLAACALRRQLALCNPLLDFDSLLFVARGTFAGSVRSNPATQDYQGGHFVTQYFGFNALPGGGLFAARNCRSNPEVVNVLRDSVVQNGRLKGAKLDHGAFATPDLSFDGKRIVFAWTENSEHKWLYAQKACWHLFTVNADGSDLRQLTDGAYNDFDPCWLPNGRIAFTSERRGGYIRCFAAYLKVRTYTLFSMKDDGTDLAPLSYYETSEWSPNVDNDGKLVYTRWDYTDRENCLGSRIWLSGPDGTDPRAPHGNYALPYETFPDHQPWKTAGNREIDSRMGAPLVEMGIRAVPDSSLYLCTGAPHHGEVFGTLCMLDLRTEDDNHMSQVKRITPAEPFPETEMPGRRHYKYGTPWPLSEDFYLCNVWENLYLLDRYGNRELLCSLRDVPCVQDERLRLIDPIPVRPRPQPPVLPTRTRQGENADPSAPPATTAVMSVYDSDLPFPKNTKIKWLRVTQNILKTNHPMGEPLIGYERENTPRIPLGIVPVEEDGSAYFEAPVAKELIFQVLDGDYMAVQSMRSSAFVHPGEQLTCQGCHEKPHRPVPTGRTDRPPLALRRPPSPLQPEIGPVEPISYYRQIKPIFDRTCVPCHKAQGKGPQDMSYEALKEGYTFWFSGAMYGNMCSDYSGVHGGSRTIPGRFGARCSKIGQALLTEAHRKAVSEEDRHKIIVWLDSNSLRLGAFTREDAQVRGELVWPELDVDPENPLGVEGRGKPLQRNFWHENQWGPHAFLCSEHAHDRVVLLDEAGRLRWEYPVPHPQDVWMLPNGNILTTYYQGVREVTRNKEVVWEYTTQKPNEIPNCQPLPDGNVLIGIVGECRLIEVNRKGDLVHQVQLSTTVKEPHAQFRMCRKTPEGTYLVPFSAEGAVREYDREGKVIREFPRLPMPVCALRLDNGNTLISGGQAVTEFDRADNVVWQLTQLDVPDLNLAVPAGIQRLSNGNTLVCNWNARDDGDKAGAHIFEVTPDKRVVWQVAGDTVGQVAQCQLLRTDLTAGTMAVVR